MRRALRAPLQRRGRRGEAGVSRATVYRHFPGGKDQLIADGVAWEVGRFFLGVSGAVEQAPDLQRKVEVALVEGRRLLREHEVLHQILREDPEQLLAQLGGVFRQVLVGIRQYVASLLAREELEEGVVVEDAAEYVARLYLSYLGHNGGFDLDDPDQVEHLVRTQFLAGIVRL